MEKALKCLRKEGQINRLDLKQSNSVITGYVNLNWTTISDYFPYTRANENENAEVKIFEIKLVIKMQKNLNKKAIYKLIEFNCIIMMAL